MKLSPDQPELTGPDSDPVVNPRLNLLLSYGGWRQGTVVDQLPHLLHPMGIRSIRVSTGEEAAEVIDQIRIHIAVVDLEIPLTRSDLLRFTGSTAGGARTLRLLRRLAQPPPTVVVRPPQPEKRKDVRDLLTALREGAFAVLDRPLELETTLEVMRRILRRYYADVWPE